ncbi:MAG TPA: tail protein X [Candidatus Binataceae bacterium]
MASEFLTHITSAGERWDLLAWQYYGDPAAYSQIIMANPNIPIEAAFEAGRVIAIPVIRRNIVLAAGLPPWKRASGQGTQVA